MRPDLPSVVAGLCLVCLGIVLALDAAGTISLRFAALGPIAFGVLGAILLALGLSRDDD